MPDGQASGIRNQQSELKPSGTLLAFDFGTRRIGVAVGNTFSSSAQPLVTIDEEKNALRFAAIEALVREWQPCALVVGLPGNDDGTPHELTALCRRFANRLHGRYGLPTLLVDERYTSLAASEQLNKQGIRGRQQILLPMIFILMHTMIRIRRKMNLMMESAGMNWGDVP